MTTAPQRYHNSPAAHRARRAAVARFYTEHAAQLRAMVARRVHTSAGVEDACQHAWVILLAHPEIDLDHRGLRWLTTVAVREAWQHARSTIDLQIVPSDLDLEPDDLAELPEPAGPASDPVDIVIARDQHQQRREAFVGLKAREREALWLHALGHSYREIAELTGSTYTATNRRITEGRARLRPLEQRQGGE